MDLVEAVTHVAGSKAELQAQLTTKLAKDDLPGGMDASHLPPSPIDWSHVTGLLPLIGQCVRLFKEQFVSLEENLAKVCQGKDFDPYVSTIEISFTGGLQTTAAHCL